METVKFDQAVDLESNKGNARPYLVAIFFTNFKF